MITKQFGRPRNSKKRKQWTPGCFIFMVQCREEVSGNVLQQGQNYLAHLYKSHLSSQCTYFVPVKEIIKEGEKEFILFLLWLINTYKLHKQYIFIFRWFVFKIQGFNNGVCFKCSMDCVKFIFIKCNCCKTRRQQMLESLLLDNSLKLSILKTVKLLGYVNDLDIFTRIDFRREILLDNRRHFPDRRLSEIMYTA